MADSFAQGLIQSLLQSTQAPQGPSSADMAAIMQSKNPMATYMAANVDRTAGKIGEGVRGMLGGIKGQEGSVLSPNEMMQQQLSKSNLSTSEDYLKLSQMARAAGKPAEAIQLNMAAQELKVKEDAQAATLTQQGLQRATGTTYLTDLASTVTDKKAKAEILALMNPVSSGAMSTQEASAQAEKIMTRYKVDAKPLEGSNYKVVGNAVFDTATKEWLTPPTVKGDKEAAGGLAEQPGIDFDQYDPTSFQEASNAFDQAKTPEAKQAAMSLLLPKPRTGEEWRMLNGAKVIYPVTGEPRQEANKAIAAANNARNMAKRSGENFIEVTDGILNDLNSGKTSTGAFAGVLGYVPGTPYWDQRVSVDTLLSNLGIDALSESRASSVNGSSGFGQLTQSEMVLLKEKVRNLSLSQSQKQFTENLLAVRETYATMLAKDGGEMSMADYVGAPRQVSTIAAPSGTEYTVEVVQ